MEAGLREEQPTPPPADSPQRHNSALSNAGCSSGAGASRVWTLDEILASIPAGEGFTLSPELEAELQARGGK